MQKIDDSLPVEQLHERANRCASKLIDENTESVMISSHIDADGLTSGAIAARCLERAGVAFDSTFFKQLDRDAVEAIAATEHDTVLFTDFGSGQLDIISEFAAEGYFTPVISDHHEPVSDSSDAEIDIPGDYHLNPLLVGVDGSTELSGAGTTYVLSRHVAELLQNGSECDDIDVPHSNKDLAKLAIVGALGDMQGGTEGLSGANTDIVVEAIEAGVIEKEEDIALYGRQTRPVTKLLEYSTDIRIPGITGSESGAIEFLESVDVNLTDVDGNWKHWVDLTDAEKTSVVSGLIQTAIDRGVPSKRVNDIVGTIYQLTGEKNKTPLRDASEFSTLLNATARYEREDVGLAVCLGDRKGAYHEAERLLKNHQQNISEGIDWVIENGTTKEESIQWFDAGSNIRETIVGIIAGMSLGESGIEQHMPIIAFATKPADESEEIEGNTPELKVSSRATRRSTRNGVDLSAVMEQAADAVGGGGGGHDIAAGATIPETKRDEFINQADSIVSDQLSE
jgi:RecJ-like exonuclease